MTEAKHTQIDMHERRTWYGRKVFTIDGDDGKPKTFHEREQEKTEKFAISWLFWSLIPSATIAGFYLWPHSLYWDGSSGTTASFGWPGAGILMGASVLMLANLPNVTLLIMRSVALWAVTGGR